MPDPSTLYTIYVTELLYGLDGIPHAVYNPKPNQQKFMHIGVSKEKMLTVKDDPRVLEIRRTK